MVDGEGSARRELTYLVELVGVTAVAVAQPVFDVIQQAPEELVNRRAGAADLVAFALLRYLALAAPVFAGLFLFASPVSDLVVGGTVDPADVEIADPAPVVLIALDELPQASLLDGRGHIDAETFPNFARLADEST